MAALAGGRRDPAGEIAQEAGNGGAPHAQRASLESLTFGDGGVGRREHGKNLQRNERNLIPFFLPVNTECMTNTREYYSLMAQ
jgi:hypothetical protein